MKRILTLLAIAAPMLAAAQPAEYMSLVSKGDSLYYQKQFKNSGESYSRAFKSYGWKGRPGDRYNAACAYALAGNMDSAFFQLNRIAVKANYFEYSRTIADPDLNGLHSDRRWAPVMAIIKANSDKREGKYNRPLMKVLDSINDEDQKYRKMMGEVEKKHGVNSQEMKNVWRLMARADSTNLIVVKAILNKYGWLGSDEVGDTGNSTLFLVIQHADLTTQEKYLPMMRDAVKNGRAEASTLALLEDRVALGQGKKQIYGSQIGRDNATGKYFISPIEDEPNVNKRRAAVGLGPLEEYVKRWGIDYKSH